MQQGQIVEQPKMTTVCGKETGVPLALTGPCKLKLCYNFLCFEMVVLRNNMVGFSMSRKQNYKLFERLYLLNLWYGIIHSRKNVTFVFAKGV